jgi:hypothetical protein
VPTFLTMITRWGTLFIREIMMHRMHTRALRLYPIIPATITPDMTTIITAYTSI